MAIKRTKRPTAGNVPAGSKGRSRRRASSGRAVKVVKSTGGHDTALASESGQVMTVSVRDLEDLIDGVEASRRLADPMDGQRLSWAETKARLGL